LNRWNIWFSTLRLRQLPSDFSYEGISLRELSRKYGVDGKVIKRWIKEQKINALI
jgi:transposase